MTSSVSNAQERKLTKNENIIVFFRSDSRAALREGSELAQPRHAIHQWKAGLIVPDWTWMPARVFMFSPTHAATQKTPLARKII
jgi:hypothetical protein